MVGTQRQLNILCIGQLQAGKSRFLQKYTNSPSSDQHYKIFVTRSHSTTIFLHQIQEKEGQEVYLTYPYDGVLFFINALSYQNTHRAIMDYLSLFSHCSGLNIYRIPIMAVVVAHQQAGLYQQISWDQKTKLQQQISSVLPHSQIIHIQDGNDSQRQLADFYQAILEEEHRGIKQTIYTQWFMKGIFFFIPFRQIQLQVMKIVEQFKQISLLKFALLRRLLTGKTTSKLN